MVSACDNAIICDDCNAADPIAKRAVGADRNFSFSPQEIRRFVKPQANTPHEIDVSIARQIRKENSETLQLRLKIVQRIAFITASNKHWYQELLLTERAEFIYTRADDSQRRYGLYSAIYQLAGDTIQRAPVENSAWRRVHHWPPASRPGEADIAFLAQVRSRTLARR